MAIKQLSATEFLEQFSPHLAHPIVGKLPLHPDAVAVVCFENCTLDSTACGERTAVIVGPSNTFESVEACEGKWLNDLPSQRQHPVTFATAEDLRAWKGWQP